MSIKSFAAAALYDSSDEENDGIYVKYYDHVKSHAYDESKERELFEALTDKECPGADLRRCGKEEESYMNFYVAERWIGWKSCAKSRARSA